MGELEGCIRYHEGIIFHSKAYLEPSAQYLEELTVKCLKELQEIKKEKEGKNGLSGMD